MKLNLGCGNRERIPGFTNVDLVRGKNIDIRCDVRHLPMIKDNSVELIYASHILEYFDRTEVINVLKEWKRVLQSKGTLRIAVPDFEAMAISYHMSKFFNNSKVKIEDILGPLYGKQPLGNGEYCYHRTAYDFTSLRKLLHDNGFIVIHRYNWKYTVHKNYDDWSQSYLPKFKKSPDEPGYKDGMLISLNVEATKP